MKTNRIWVSVLLTALLLWTCLAGCGPAADSRESKSGQPGAQNYDDNFIEELVYAADYVPPEGESDAPLPISYNLPLLRSDAPEAQAFNASLRQLRDKAAEGDIYYSQVSWESYWHGSLVSLVLTLRRPWQSDTQADYCTCSFDFSEGHILSNRELLKQAKLTPEEAERALRCTAARQFDMESLPLSSLYGDCFDGILELRSRMLSRANLDIDSVPLFLGPEDVLYAISRVGTPAGGGDYMAILALAPVPGPGVSKTVTLANLTAELKDDQVTLTFKEQAPAGESPISGVNIEYGKTYPVLGLYGQYTDLALGYGGNDGSLFLCLTDKNGQVSVCNILAAALSGSDFCATGPLPEPQQVIGYEPVSASDGYDLLALLAGGEKVSLGDYFSRAERTVPLYLQDSSWLTPDKAYALKVNMTECDYAEAVWGDQSGVLGSGYLYYDGMTEEGLRFRTSLYGEDGACTQLMLIFATHSGAGARENPAAAAGEPLSQFLAGGGLEFNTAATSLRVLHLSGEPLCGVPEGSGGAELLRDWEAHSADYLQEIRVSTADELMRAIGSNVRILLAPGVYNLSAWADEEYLRNMALPPAVQMVWDRSLCLTGLSNLSLMAEQPEKETKITVTDESIPVLSFADCRELRLCGLSFGHEAVPGFCTGTVLKLEECTGVTLEQVDLYGCGTYGLEVYGGDKLHMFDSTVHDCSCGALYLMLCEHGDFHGSSFLRCGQLTVLDSSGGELSFSGCTFRENQGRLFPQPGDYDMDSHFYFEDTDFGEAEALEIASGNDLVTVR